MDGEDHIQSAVDAMKALQEKIEQLERENAQLKHDVTILRLQHSANNSIFSESEMKLNDEAEKLANQLSGATEVLTNLRQIRREKSELQEVNKQIELDLGTQLRNNIMLKNKLKLIESKMDETLQSEDEFDAILLDYLLPPPIKTVPKLDIQFNLNNSTKEPTSKSGKFQKLLKTVQSLPATTKGEKLESKKHIFTTLRSVKEEIERIDYEILTIERSNQPKQYKDAKIQSKTIQKQALQGSTNRFHVH